MWWQHRCLEEKSSALLQQKGLHRARGAGPGQWGVLGGIRGRAESEGQGLSGRGRGERGGGEVVGLGGVEQGSVPVEDSGDTGRRSGTPARWTPMTNG
jgi:hypothetical protein